MKKDKQEKISKKEAKKAAKAEKIKTKYKEDGTKVEIKVAKDANISRKEKTFRMCLLALLIGILLLMNFSPMGYIFTGALSITLMIIPVVVGAISLGNVAGIILGGVFGLTSFLQCFGVGYVVDPTAPILFGENPYFAAITCFVPRMLMGLCVSLVFKLVLRIEKFKKLAYPVAAAFGAILNTAFFMTFLILFYKNTVLGGKTVLAIILPILSINFLVEFCVSLVLGAAVAIAFDRALKMVTKR